MRLLSEQKQVSACFGSLAMASCTNFIPLIFVLFYCSEVLSRPTGAPCSVVESMEHCAKAGNDPKKRGSPFALQILNEAKQLVKS